MYDYKHYKMYFTLSFLILQLFLFVGVLFLSNFKAHLEE